MVCVFKHLYCSAQLSMSNMEKRYRNKIIVIIIIIVFRFNMGSNPACDGILSGSSHTSELKNWHSSGYPARRLAL